MFDFKFDWEKSIETGIEEIDTQHKQLFKIGRDMEQLLRMQCIGVTDKQLLDIVCELRDFTGYHFYAEESMMNEMKYAGMKEHVAFHKRCSEFIMRIDLPKLKADPVKELGKIKDEVQLWIMMHLLKEDKEMCTAYRSFLNEKTKAEEKQQFTEEEFGSFITGLDVTKLYLYKDQTCRGHMAAVFQESARELCMLSTLERNMFFADIAKAAKTLKKTFAPDAICYEDHEDTGEKLVFHIIPKYKKDGTYGKIAGGDGDEDRTDEKTFGETLLSLQNAFR